LKERFPGLQPLRVVVAYDVRRFEDVRKSYNPKLPNPVLHLTSRDLAHHAVGVYVANGIEAFTLPADSTRYLATPELSYNIRLLKAHGGLNISASHNPPDDNGAKFYDERGGQPVPPDDQIMADLVDQVAGIKTLSWSDSLRTGRVRFLDHATHQAYIDLCRKQTLVQPPKANEIQVVFTPLHGVGSMTAMEVLVQHGFHVLPVEEQMKPDGMFPNVTQTPNPEVPVSMDRAEALAKRENADLVLSTDPDADRLGAMIPFSEPGELATEVGEPSGVSRRVAAWRFVTGNEIAALLTHFKLNQLKQRGQMPGSPIVIKTEVTTGLITRIARHFRAQVVDNLLVGFKYIADVLWHLEQDGAYEDVRGTPRDFVIGGEESHGILVTPEIRDKDAAGGALLLAELALDQKRKGKTLLDYLEAIYRQFGYFRNEIVPVVMSGIEGKQNMARMLDQLRKTPLKEIGGLAVTAFEDFRDEHGRMGPIKGATDAASRNVLLFRFGEEQGAEGRPATGVGGRVALRPSGTEPKAKAYIEVCSSPCPAGASTVQWQKIRSEVDGLSKRIAEDFLRKIINLAGIEPRIG